MELVLPREAGACPRYNFVNTQRCNFVANLGISSQFKVIQSPHLCRLNREAQPAAERDDLTELFSNHLTLSRQFWAWIWHIPTGTRASTGAY
jgi:hypothetical protein